MIWEYCMDTEISSPYPEFWGTGVYNQTFPEGIEGDAGVWKNGADIHVDHIHLVEIGCQ